ncbi:kirola-like [Lycium barbarum]|uniref:kirola-like n=1 Tax=Lycium barbarum TaxID=112863 RepID=UPI00293E8C66|nr:kirola-like [Lycium barbarum]
MGLKSKLSVQLEVKTKHDVFLDVFWKTPNQCSTMSPVQVQGAELLEGDHFGAVGSKVCWKYTHDGKEKISKQIIEAIDEEKKILTLKEFEGDILNEYENVKYTLHVDAEGEKHLACWTIEYERPKENTPELTSLLQFLIDMIKAIDDHHIKQN